MVNQQSEQLKELAVTLHEINAIKFGDFLAKSGIRTPIYFDLRVIISYPKVMDLLSVIVSDFIRAKNIDCDNICGVPYTALPIATLVSVKDKKPMLIRRKEVKSYGTKKLIEGKFDSGDKCLIIEDVVTSGSSILETANDLKSEGIVVADAIVVVNREQGGELNINNNNIRLHSIYTLSALLNILQEAGKIDDSIISSVSKHIAESQVKTKEPPSVLRTSLTYAVRASLTKCPIAKILFEIISTKKTNLCLAADLEDAEAILNLADSVGPYICVLKTHIDIVTNYTADFVASLTALALKHNFLLMEDRKFADIGNTSALQYTSGLYNISKWAHLVTIHSLAGSSQIQGLKSALPASSDDRGVFILAEMSSSGNLITPEYTESSVQLALNGTDADFVAGIVAQTKGVLTEPGLLQLTPGCKIDDTSDALGQQYNTPEHVIKEKGADIAVVGRGIINAKSPQSAAKLYRNRLWAAYCDRVGITNDI